MELNLDIPEVRGFKEDVLMLVVKDSEYGKRVPVAIGTLHIDMILETATKEELENMGRKWQRGSLGRKITMKQNVVTKEDTPFELKKIGGEVKVTKNVVIKPFHMVRLSAKSKVRQHHKNVHIITEDREENERELPNLAVVPCYGILKQGSDRVPVILKNLTCKPITLQKGKVVAEIGPANAIPSMLAPKIEKENSDKTGKETFQFILPQRFRKRALEACHDEFGRQGMDKTTFLLQKRFFWNGLVNDTREHIRNCGRCLTFKTTEETSELERIECSYPLEMLHLDFLTIGQVGKDSKGEKKKPVNVLVVTDHFTRFSQAYVTHNQKAKTVAETLWEKYLSQYGWPEKILTDQGGSFEAELFEELCKETKITKIRTCP